MHFVVNGLSCFHFGAILSKATMNILIHIIWRTYIYISGGFILRSEISVSSLQI